MILQGRVSNPSERGTAPPNYFDPRYLNQTILALEEIVGARRSYDIAMCYVKSLTKFL